MGAAVALWDIVGVAENVFLEGVIPLQCDLHADAIGVVLLEVEGFVDGSLVLVQVVDEGLQTPFILVDFFFSCALILQHYAYAGIEESQLPQALGKLIEMEFDIGERI